MQYLHEDEEVLEPPLLEEPHQVRGERLLLIRRNLHKRTFLELKQKQTVLTQVFSLSRLMTLQRVRIKDKKSLSIFRSRK